MFAVVSLICLNLAQNVGTIVGPFAHRKCENGPNIPDQGPEPMALTALKVKNAKPGRHVDSRGFA
ncbi:hypothetical protein FIM10_17165 [Sphingomonadales bacterium 56]|uniref:Uncharacterized protein n=1 Tax=Sphingobium indicum TaxID=332055 RepID=A0A4Q4IWT9_9SPHN|nr:hypothetical protein [Sphingomonadales bacterium 56]MBY2960426.1 hypothetical protein [Sphingomonadales bacterium 58]PZU65721.1 MAG: hypothetical protein DI546_23770 [Rhizobium sp.]QEH80948.1 hypothetical protein EIK56_23680 [Sphingomonas sp. C8-2]RYL96650.1 hypothetical protein EWH10_18080 [Sphingobium fuliginis]RYL97917.1 hypothetical protein EWH08_18040 [Sphingobium indicum]HCW62274.1 hypothetical protein [Sphingobium sp.]